MSDSNTYASAVIATQFNELPKELKVKIKSAIRIAWIDGHLAQIELTLQEIRRESLPNDSDQDSSL